MKTVVVYTCKTQAEAKMICGLLQKYGIVAEAAPGQKAPLGGQVQESFVPWHVKVESAKTKEAEAVLHTKQPSATPYSTLSTISARKPVNPVTTASQPWLPGNGVNWSAALFLLVCVLAVLGFLAFGKNLDFSKAEEIFNQATRTLDKLIRDLLPADSYK